MSPTQINCLTLPDLVVDGDILIQENGHDVLHVIFDLHIELIKNRNQFFSLYLFSLSISSHGEILLHFAELVNVSLAISLLISLLISSILSLSLFHDLLERGAGGLTW